MNERECVKNKKEKKMLASVRKTVKKSFRSSSDLSGIKNCFWKPHCCVLKIFASNKLHLKKVGKFWKVRCPNKTIDGDVCRKTEAGSIENLSS